MTEYTVFANNSQTGVQFNFSMAVLADTDGDGLLDDLEVKCGSSPSDLSDVAKVDENGDCIVEDSSSDGEKDSEFNYFLCCLPLIILLLLLLNFFGRQRVVFLDAEPEHTPSEPKCLEGTGTKED